MDFGKTRLVVMAGMGQDGSVGDEGDGCGKKALHRTGLR
jgi:hypothetical protein